MANLYKRLLSATLAFMFVGQVLIYGDGTAQGIAHAATIDEIQTAIEQNEAADILETEALESTDGLGNITYFDVDTEAAQTDEESIFSPILVATGYVSLLDGRAPTNAKVILYDGWTEVGSTYVDENGYFEVGVEGVSNDTNIKIECDGYVPQFFKGMGNGAYELSTAAEPIALVPGDTLFNKSNGNAWSDEVLDINDLNFVSDCLGARAATVNYNAYFDLDSDGNISAEDIASWQSYINEIGTDYTVYYCLDLNGDGIVSAEDAECFASLIGSTNADYIAIYDFDEDGAIGTADSVLFSQYVTECSGVDYTILYYLDANADGVVDETELTVLNSLEGETLGDSNYYQYMDIDENGIIDETDYAWFSNNYDLYAGTSSDTPVVRNVKLLSHAYKDGGMWLYNWNLDLNGCVLAIDGDMSFMTSAPELWSEGDGAKLTLDGGNLLIAGNFNFGQANCYDRIIMQNANDYLAIYGYWNYCTSVDGEGLWTAGLIDFYGPAWQVNEASGEKSVYSIGNHMIAFGYEYGTQVIRWDNRYEYMYDNDGNPTTGRTFNFNYENGLLFRYDYTADNYYFRPWLPFPMEEVPDYTLYRRGWEMGDGVHIATGNYSKSFTDMNIASPGVTSDFVRTYNSTSTEKGSFGIGWDFNIDVSKIVIPARNYYQVVLPDGSNTTFKKNGNTYECLNAHSTMEELDGGYVITNAAQSKYYFNSDGKLYKVEDAKDNALTISDIENNIRTVTDSTGRTYKITYENDLVVEIEDTATGRKVTYDYTDGRLTSFTNVMGGVETYSYDADGKLNSITNCYDQVTESVVYLDEGKVDILTTAAGLKQEYTYNPEGQQTGIKEYDDGVLVKTYEYNYDEKYSITSKTVITDGKTYEVDKVTYHLVNGENKYNEVASSTDIQGNTTYYEYDSNGNVTKTTSQGGGTIYAKYNEKNSLIMQMDEMGYPIINVYDEDGVTLMKSARGLIPVDNIWGFPYESDYTQYLNNHADDFAITSYTYCTAGNIKGLVATQTDPVGNVTTYTYYDSGTSMGQPKTISIGVSTITYEYNAQLMVSKETTSMGYAKTYDYDAFNNVIRTYDYGTAGLSGTPNVTRVVYDKLSRKIKEVSPNYYDAALDNGFEYDADNTQDEYTRYSYDAADQVIAQTDALGNTTSYAYNAYGNVIKTTNPNGTQNLVSYDGLGREIQTAFKESTSAEQTQILTSTSYEFIQWISHPEYSAMDTQAWRSAHGLRTTKTTYVDENTTLVHTVESDYRGNTIKEYTNGTLKRTSHYYTNGTLRSTTDALDNTTKYSYNGLGKVVKTLVPFIKDASGNIVYSITENTYNKNGNVVLVKQTVNEQSAATAYSYTANTYDAQGRLIQVHQYGDADDVETIAKYFYNADGVLTEMQTGASSADYLSTTYTYDAWNRLVTTNESTGYCSGSMTYDRNGNVLTSTDANGYVTTNTYDALNRVVFSETETGNSSKDVSKSTYYNNMGQVSRTVCNGQTTWYTYDLMGRLIQESGTQFTGYYYVGSSESLARTVTGKSNLLMYSTISYTYDSEMRLATVSTNGDLTATYAYDANGNKLSETLANGVVTRYTYNNANRITDLVSTKNGETIENYHYTYYLDGSDAQKTSVVNGVESTTAYTYDGIRRLATETVTNGNTETVYSYTYDQFGNRASMTVSGDAPYTSTYNYNDADGNYTGLLQSETKTLPEADELTLIPDANIQVTLYAYDANGNQLTVTDYEGKVKNYAYDGLNQLISYSDDENTASYTYRMDGMRRSKTVNGTTITHIWVGGQIVADVTGNYTANCYVRGTNLLAQYDFNYGASDDYTYYLQNAHGDVTALLDTAGELTKSYVYDAFGVEQNIDDSDSNAFRYCGEYYDTETGTVYLRARYYNPVTGRFISRDSYVGRIGAPLSLNLYTYCTNNPIVLADPSGHIGILTALAIGAIIGAAVGAGSSATIQYCTTGTINGKDVAISAACGAAGGLAGGAAAGVCSAVATAGASSSLAATASLSSANVVIGTGIISGGVSSYASTAMRQSLYGYSDPNELIDNTLFGATTGGALGAATWGISNSSNINAWLRSQITPAASTDVIRYSPMNPGPLSNDVANSFRSSSYYAYPLSSDTNFYRMYSDPKYKVGSYMTRTPQNGVMQTQLDLALNPDWGNYATNMTQVTVPKGTVIYEGVAGPQIINGGAGQLLGGGNQVYIPEVDANWFN